QVRSEEDVEAVDDQRRREQPMQFQHREAQAMERQPNPEAGSAAAAGQAGQTFVRDGRKVGRNEPCPCGSGKKYKQCHGKLD
ncbi:MAG: SEC-C metal-binding domain-containing protein, partial [Wenzhouxiangellaceae bacterium]|nr:SEC-C metal-binding domain-containing protein [Wenzhouxiangellaceae bacterium]